VKSFFLNFWIRILIRFAIGYLICEVVSTESL